jgi:hypothetical protein
MKGRSRFALIYCEFEYAPIATNNNVTNGGMRSEIKYRLDYQTQRIPCRTARQLHGMLIISSRVLRWLFFDMRLTLVDLGYE